MALGSSEINNSEPVSTSSAASRSSILGELGYISKEVPTYNEHPYRVKFESEQEWQSWFECNPENHATWNRNGSTSDRTGNNGMNTRGGRPVKYVKKFRFVCNRARKPPKKNVESSESSSITASSNKRKHTSSNRITKVNCPAKINLYKYTDGSYEAVYYWCHFNHDPTDSEEIIGSRLPKRARKWIIERVEENLDWGAIQNVLRLTRKERDYLDENSNILPLSELIHYKDVRNLIQSKLARLSKKAALDKDSVRLWLKYLIDEGYDVLQYVDEECNRFTIAWVSKWQKRILQRQDFVCIDSTHKTCKSFLRSADSCYLFTIVCKNPDTNKGCPVGFMVTNSETTMSLATWFEWLKNVINFVPKTIMIDCSPVEMNAVYQIYGDIVQVLLCHWHIRREWEKYIKKLVKVEDSIHKTAEKQQQIRATLNILMQSDSIDMFDGIWDSLKITWCDENGYAAFYDYLNQYWYPKREKWCKAWRPNAMFSTNSMIESWHNHLKTVYLSNSRNHRVDRIMYVLTEKVELDFRRDEYQIKRGIRPVWLSTEERKRRKAAYDLPELDANNMVTINDNVIKCKSSTSSTSYLLSLEQTGPTESTVVSCTCPDFISLGIICKHMFIVNRVKNIPLRTHTLRYSPALPAPVQEENNINDTNHGLQQLLTQAINRCNNHVAKKRFKMNNEQLEQMINIWNNMYSNLEKMADPHKKQQ